MIAGVVTIERREAPSWRLDARRLEGLAAPYGVRTQIADFHETIAPGAFAETLRRAGDVLGLVDHDPSKLLARTKSGTLKLTEDAAGLRFALEIPDTALGRDILALVQRGDIGGASIGFRIPKGGDSWEGRERTLRRVELVDVSVVQSFPAYPTTFVTARAQSGQRRLSLSLAERYIELKKG